MSEETNPVGDDQVEELEVGQGCIEGLRCPQCGNFQCFSITALAVFRVVEDGTDGHGDVTWCDDSPCFCRSCLHEGTVAYFRGQAPAPVVPTSAALEPSAAAVKARVKSIIYDAENSTSFSEEIGQLVRRLMDLEAHHENL